MWPFVRPVCGSSDTRSKKVLAWNEKTDCQKSFFDRISGGLKHTAGQLKASGVSSAFKREEVLAEEASSDDGAVNHGLDDGLLHGTCEPGGSTGDGLL
jgi:hypothetical protein